MIIMNVQSYCVINLATNVCDNVVLWDGDTNTWQPPENCLMLVQAETPAKDWVWDDAAAKWVLIEVMGVGSVGFVWDGEFLIESISPPAPPTV